MGRSRRVQMLFNLYLNWASVQIKNLFHGGKSAKVQHPGKKKKCL